MFYKIGLQFCYYRVLSKALLGFSVPDNQPSMTAHYNPNSIPYNDSDPNSAPRAEIRVGSLHSKLQFV